MKNIKPSKRGLTFSFTENETFPIGSHFSYIIDIRGGSILIIPDAMGENTVSRKRVGISIKSLIDLRSRQVKEFLYGAELLEIEECDDGILITAVKYDVSGDLNNEDATTIFISDSVFNEIEQNTSKNGQTFEKKVYTVLSLFSGAGMLDFPFINDGRFKIVYAVDYDAAAVSSYNVNIGGAVVADIRTIDETKLPAADVIVGGPSCKPFSNANRIRRMEDHKDFDLFSEYLRIVKGVNPYIFALENVPYFLKSISLDDLRTKLREFKISFRVFSDVDLGGYTLRKRLLLCGCRLKHAVHFPEIKRSVHKTVREALQKVNRTWFNYEDVSASHDNTLNRMSMIPEGSNHTVLPLEMRTKSTHSGMLRRLHLDQPACSLPNVRKTCILHPVKDRILSVAECLALSGFDCKFRVLGSLGQRQQQVANGVPYSFGKYLANIIGNELDKYFLKKGIMKEVYYAM